MPGQGGFTGNIGLAPTRNEGKDQQTDATAQVEQSSQSEWIKPDEQEFGQRGARTKQTSGEQREQGGALQFEVDHGGLREVTEYTDQTH